MSIQQRESQSSSVDEDVFHEFQNEMNNKLDSSKTDCQYTDIYSEYLSTVLSDIFHSDWLTKPVKSNKNYNNFDQTMFSHVLYGSFALYKISKSLQIDVERFRNTLGMWSVHEIHKLDSTLADEFKIEKEEVERVVGRFRVSDFAPDADIPDFRSTAVGHHRYDEGALTSDLTDRFLKNHSLIRAADAVASQSDPSYGSEDSFVEIIASVSDWEYTATSHSLSRLDGHFSAVLNSAVVSYLSDNGAIPIDYTESGCVYIHPAGKSIDELVPDSRPEKEIADEFLDSLKQYLSEYRSEISLSESAGKCEYSRVPTLTELEKACYTSDKLISILIENTLLDIDYYDTVTEIDEKNIADTNTAFASEGVDIQVEKTSRMSAVSSLLSALDENVAQSIVCDGQADSNESIPASQTTRLGVIVSAFEFTNSQYTTISELLMLVNDPESPVRRQQFQYALSQMLIDNYFTGESYKSVGEQLTDDIVTRLQKQNPNWKSFGVDSTRRLKQEIAKSIVSCLHVDGERIDTYSELNPLGAFSTFNKQGTCSLCQRQTYFAPGKHSQPALVAATQKETNEKLDQTVKTPPKEEPVNLESYLVNQNRDCCAVCQIDIRIRTQSDSWGSEKSPYAISLGRGYNPVSDQIHMELESIAKTDILRNSTTALHPENLASELFNSLDSSEFDTSDILQSETVPYSPHFLGCTPAGKSTPSSEEDTIQLIEYYILTSILTGKHLKIQEYPVIGSQKETPAKQDSLISVSEDNTEIRSLIGKKLGVDSISEQFCWIRGWNQLAGKYNDSSNNTNVFYEFEDKLYGASQCFDEIYHRECSLSEKTTRKMSQVALTVDTIGSSNTVLDDTKSVLYSVTSRIISLSNSQDETAIKSHINYFFNEKFGKTIYNGINSQIENSTTIIGQETAAQLFESIEKVVDPNTIRDEIPEDAVRAISTVCIASKDTSS